MGADCKYEGTVDFGDWQPDVRSAADMAAELQATFVQPEQNVFMGFDGVSVSLFLDCLGNGDFPKFTASIHDMAKDFAFWHDDEPETDADAAKALVAELRRAADLIESLYFSPSATHPQKGE